jgi:hypothetical protein
MLGPQNEHCRQGIVAWAEGEKIEKECRPEETVESYVAAQTSRWRALGAVGKVHNIVKFVRLNPQHRAQFLSQQMVEGESGFMLRADNDTRWNSTWKMIDSTLRQRERVKAFVSVVDDLNEDALTRQEWQDLEEVIELLAPFKWLTVLS